MTIRRRLTISNILIILLPVLLAIVICLGCMNVIWTWTTSGGGSGFADSQEFYDVCQSISREVEEAMRAADDERDFARQLQAVCRDLEDDSMRLVIRSDGEKLFDYGEEAQVDADLLEAVRALDEQGFVSTDERALYARTVEIGSSGYRILLYGSMVELTYHALGRFVLAAVLIFVVFILLVIVLANRFMQHFVLRRIQEPVSQLTAGVAHIRDGDLDYRINYAERDEFYQVCADFNEMAVRLKTSVEQTQRNEENRKELLAGISHDLRSPLTAIKACTEALLDGVVGDQETQQAYLQLILSRTDTIIYLVSQLFTLSKMEMGELPVSFCDLLLDEVIQDCVKEMQGEYRQRGLCLLTGQMVHAPVSADPDQLRRVLLNIMDNSVKYKTAGQGTLTISLQAGEGDFLLTLQDDGPGVPEEALEKLFQTFYRGDAARRNPEQGSGLGLAIAAAMIHGMHGSICAQNVQPHGLAILIRLPERGASA